MAFEANKPDFLADQHLRVGEPCGIWQLWQPSSRTGACSKVKGPRLSPWHWKQPGSLALAIRMRPGLKLPCGLWQSTQRHRIFGNPVFERFGKRRFDIDVAALALGVYVSRFARHQAIGAMGMNGMALTYTRPHCVRGWLRAALPLSADSDGR